MADNEPAAVIPLVDEHITVRKQKVETGRVRVRTLVDERETIVSEALLSGEVRVERVTVGRDIDQVPDVRQEGDTIIVPVVEEVLIVEKRLVLREELHIHRLAHVEQVEQPVTLRSQRAVVERTPGDGKPV